MITALLLVSLHAPADLFRRAEPALADGASLLQDGEADKALERFRKANAKTSNERAIVEYDAGAALLLKAQKESEPANPADAKAVPTKITGADEARAAFGRAFGLATDPRVRAEAALASGNAAALSGDVDAAIADYRKAVVADPTNDRARKNLRRALEAKKQKDQQQEQQNDGGDKNDDDKDKGDDKKDGDNNDEPQPNDNKDGDKDKGDDKKDGDKKDEPQQQPGDAGDDDKNDPAQPKDNEAQGGADDKKDDAQQKPSPTKPGEKSADKKKEEARRILRALRAREKPLGPMQPAMPVTGNKAPTDKDW